MDTVLIAVFTFVPMLLLLVVIHEWGHFVTAKAFGIKVLEFGIGYPPRAFGFYTGRTPVLIRPETRFVNLNGVDDLRPGQVVKVGSTEDREGNLVAQVIEAPARNRVKNQSSLQELAADTFLRHDGKIRRIEGDTLILADMLYSMNWTPLGGFVRLAGESNPSIPRSLASKGVGPRAIVLAAGAFMNAVFPLFALVVLAFLFMLPQQVTLGDVQVNAVAPGSPAALAEVQVGDVIAEASGEAVQHVADLQRVNELNRGSEVEWIILRDGQRRAVRLTPREDPPPGEGRTGIQINMINTRQESRRDSPVTAIQRSASTLWGTLALMGQAVAGWFNGGENPQLSGPIGIAQLTGEVSQQLGTAGWVMLAAIFSVNLAVLNILPIPMLDGGRLVFVAIEWVRRGKRIPPEKEGMVHLAGFLVLLSLILWISYRDVIRLLGGGSLLGG